MESSETVCHFTGSKVVRLDIVYFLENHNSSNMYDKIEEAFDNHKGVCPGPLGSNCIFGRRSKSCESVVLKGYTDSRNKPEPTEQGVCTNACSSKRSAAPDSLTVLIFGYAAVTKSDAQSSGFRHQV